MSEPTTTFLLTRGDDWRTAERQRVTTARACPMFHDYPAEIQALVDQGWRCTGHIDGPPRRGKR